MKQRLPAALLAASLTWAVPAVAQGALAPTTAQNAPAPVIRIILAKNHPMHGSVFSSRLNKSAYLRGEVQRKGYGVAFNEWMRQDHPSSMPTTALRKPKRSSRYSRTRRTTLSSTIFSLSGPTCAQRSRAWASTRLSRTGSSGSTRRRTASILGSKRSTHL